MLVDHFDMPVAFSRAIIVLRDGRCPSWRNDDRRIVSSLITAHDVIDRIAVIGAASEKMPDADTTRLEQGNQIWIINIAISQLVRYGLTILRIKADRDFPPATLALAVFLHTPFACPEDLQPTAVKHDINRTSSRPLDRLNIKRLAPPAQRAVPRDGKRQVHVLLSRMRMP